MRERESCIMSLQESLQRKCYRVQEEEKGSEISMVGHGEKKGADSVKKEVEKKTGQKNQCLLPVNMTSSP